MIRKQTRIQNKLGLHARAAAKLVNVASKYESDVILDTGKLTANCKSIMGLMMLAASFGTAVSLTSDNADDAIEAVDAIEALINDRFGEPE